MVISIIKKLFAGNDAGTGSETQTAPATPTAKKSTGGKKSATPDIEAFVTFVVQSLVDSPEQVTVTVLEKDRATTLQVECDKKDVGKVIGKSGRTIAAIRALANGAAGRLGKRVSVEILD